ncbi:uncharacterized mitochondrial protein AtMg00860-like [Benincasa hispida]|uniref:uncharacterized mitochondrial protein AtMg00860-like n=1 Tax=Benincasa hispida TaxID=102211 RepID=UPI0018FFDF0D|nr:uncharacterized mitochondrial protein AtMg00860-like [Benincasa hispida]
MSKAALKVNEAKIDVIAKLPMPVNVKALRSFLGHAGFYKRFVKGFSQIVRPLSALLELNRPYIFNEDFHQVFETISWSYVGPKEGKPDTSDFLRAKDTYRNPRTLHNH